MDQFQSSRSVLKEKELKQSSGGNPAGGILNEAVYKLAYCLGYAAGFGAKMYHLCYPVVLK